MIHANKRARLKEMWEADIVRSKIVDELGLSVRQVRGLCDAMGLEKRQNPVKASTKHPRRDRYAEQARKVAKQAEMPLAGVGWTEHENAILRQQWPTGMPAKDIGALIGRTGNAVQTRASEMRLERRRAEAVALVRTLPLLECETLYGPLGAFVPVSLGPVPPAKTCQWPVNGKPESLFCDALDLMDGRSYCPEHCAVAFTGFEHGNLAWWVRGPRAGFGVE